MLWACLLAVRVATLRSAIVISFRIGFVKRQQHQCARYQHCNGYYDCHGSPFAAWKAESSAMKLSACLYRLPGNLLSRHSRFKFVLRYLQRLGRSNACKQIDETGDYSSPSGLMAGS